MGREIEFRAWLKKHLKIVDVKRIDFEAQEIVYEEIDFEYEDVIREKTALFKDISLLEYTGLKDKNRVEIYDGHIVKLNNYLWLVYWNNDECCYKLKNNFDDLFLTNFKEKHLEIIGNFYENKELLKNE